MKQYIKQEISSEGCVWQELAECFNHDFGTPMESERELFTVAFGSVLSDLPKNVFEKLLRMTNVFYIFTPHDGIAEVKVFELIKPIKKGEYLRIVNFPYSSISRPLLALRGQIVHELAHVFSEDVYNTAERDKEIDRLTEKWGFKKEINARMDYWKQVDRENEKIMKKRDELEP